MKKKIYQIMLPTNEELAKIDIEKIATVIDNKDIYVSIADNPYLYNFCNVRVTEEEWDEIKFKLDLGRFEIWF